MKLHRQAGTILTLSAILFSGHVIAAPWVIGSDMHDGVDWSNNLSYSGVYQYSTGVVSDGGHDGFDGFGYLSNPSGVSVYRQADVLQDINVYRWVDTYTNNGSTQYSNTVRFYGNLGSDSGTIIDSINTFSSISHESWGYDPVFGIVWGNNSWAEDNVTHSRSWDNVYSNISLDLAIGESISIAHFVMLDRPDDNYYTDSYGRMGGGSRYNPTNTIDDVEIWADNMIANPYFEGLDSATVNSIANFDATSVPEPASFVLMAIGLTGMNYKRKKQKTV